MGHTTSTDPSRSHYITSVGGTHRRRKPLLPSLTMPPSLTARAVLRKSGVRAAF